MIWLLLAAALVVILGITWLIAKRIERHLNPRIAIWTFVLVGLLALYNGFQVFRNEIVNIYALFWFVTAMGQGLLLVLFYRAALSSDENAH